MKEALKRNKIEIIKRGILAAVCLSVMIAATVAWFVNSMSVGGTGMNVSVESGPSLTIDKDPESVKTSSNSKIFFETPASVSSLIAATHYWRNESNKTGLEYITNSDVIDASTGLPRKKRLGTAETGSVEETEEESEGETEGETEEESEEYETLNFADVPVSDGEYYVDYTVYIASIKTAMTVSSLKATLSYMESANADFEPYINAASADFYIDSVSKDNYRGTLNVAGLDYEKNRKGGEKGDLKEIDLVKKDTKLLIPLQSQGSIKVVMRFYFDGDLLDENNIAFVHADQLELADLFLKVSFEAIQG